MNESEWLAAENPIAMIRAVRGRVTERKLRLCCCALCRCIWDQFADERCRRAVEVAERCADGVAAPEELDAARAEVSRAGEPYRLARRNQPAWVQAAWMTVARTPRPESVLGYTWPLRAEGEDPADRRARRQARDRALLYDLLGPLPFRPVSVDPAWPRSDVLALARGIYEDRAFDRLPALADALEDGGCDNADILDHCRDTNATHVRGCWALDLVLGKE